MIENSPFQLLYTDCSFSILNPFPFPLPQSTKRWLGGTRESGHEEVRFRTFSKKVKDEIEVAKTTTQKESVCVCVCCKLVSSSHLSLVST